MPARARPWSYGEALFNRLQLNCRLHDLRHTHATLLLKGGVSSKVASARLGHANVGITLDLYAHVLQVWTGRSRPIRERYRRGAKQLDKKYRQECGK